MHDRVQEKHCEIVRDQERRLDIRILSPEFEIISCLFDTPRQTPKELRAYFNGSSAGFFNLLRRLSEVGAIEAVRDPSDKRKKVYCLTSQYLDGIRHIVSARPTKNIRAFHRTYGSGRQEPLSSAQANEVLANIVFFTCEYQILRSLFVESGLSNMDFDDLIAVSKAKFNSSLKTLQEKHHIFAAIDPADKRRRRYFLSEETRQIVNLGLERIDSWMESWLVSWPESTQNSNNSDKLETVNKCIQHQSP